jgi:hypothetical protein
MSLVVSKLLFLEQESRCYLTLACLLNNWLITIVKLFKEPSFLRSFNPLLFLHHGWRSHWQQTLISPCLDGKHPVPLSQVGCFSQTLALNQRNKSNMCWSNHDFFDGLNPDCWRPESLSQWHALLKEQYIYIYIHIHIFETWVGNCWNRTHS